MSRTWKTAPYWVQKMRNQTKHGHTWWRYSCGCDYCHQSRTWRKEMKGKLLEEDYKEEL